MAFSFDQRGERTAITLLRAQVIAMPHLGAHSDGATNAMGRMELDNCLAVLKGETPPDRVQ